MQSSNLSASASADAPRPPVSSDAFVTLAVAQQEQLNLFRAWLVLMTLTLGLWLMVTLSCGGLFGLGLLAR